MKSCAIAKCHTAASKLAPPIPTRSCARMRQRLESYSHNVACSEYLTGGKYQMKNGKHRQRIVAAKLALIMHHAINSSNRSLRRRQSENVMKKENYSKTSLLHSSSFFPIVWGKRAYM